jgi:hypothetical protein
MSRGHKERTPAQLAVLAQAREKAKIVIAERAKLNALAKKDEAVSDPLPEPVLEDPPEPEDEPVSVSEEAPQPVPLEPIPLSVLEEAPTPPEPASESEDEEPRPKYRYVHGVGYIKIK